VCTAVRNAVNQFFLSWLITLTVSFWRDLFSSSIIIRFDYTVNLPSHRLGLFFSVMADIKIIFNANI